jgi:hypothetical protein
VSRNDEGLVVQRLDEELLVYDTDSHQAHRLDGAAAAAFAAASSDVSRREVLRKLALAGAGAAGASLVTMIVAPTAAQAQSGCGAGPACTGGDICLTCGGISGCQFAGTVCCGANVCDLLDSCLTCPGGPICATLGSYCCGATTCLTGSQACCNGACVPETNTQCGPTCTDCAFSQMSCALGICV